MHDQASGVPRVCRRTQLPLVVQRANVSGWPGTVTAEGQSAAALVARAAHPSYVVRARARPTNCADITSAFKTSVCRTISPAIQLRVRTSAVGSLAASVRRAGPAVSTSAEAASLHQRPTEAATKQRTTQESLGSGDTARRLHATR